MIRPVTPVGLALVVALGACSTTHHVAHPLPPEKLAELSSDLRGAPQATVQAEPDPVTDLQPRPGQTFKGPTLLEGYNVRVMTEKSPGVIIPLAHVREIDADHTGQGFLKGLGVGGLAGVALAGLLALAIGSGDCASDFCLGGKEIFLVGALYFGSMGALAGGPIGAVKGSGPVWRFTPAAR